MAAKETYEDAGSGAHNAALLEVPRRHGRPPVLVPVNAHTSVSTLHHHCKITRSEHSHLFNDEATLGVLGHEARWRGVVDRALLAVDRRGGHAGQVAARRDGGEGRRGGKHAAAEHVGDADRRAVEASSVSATAQIGE
jgi:hypothetical protein